VSCFLPSTFLMAQFGRCAGYVFTLWRQMPPGDPSKIANEDAVEVRLGLRDHPRKHSDALRHMSCLMPSKTYTLSKNLAQCLFYALEIFAVS